MIINNNVLTTYTVKETHFMGRIIISQLTKYINNHSLSSLIYPLSFKMQKSASLEVNRF